MDLYDRLFYNNPLDPNYGDIKIPINGFESSMIVYMTGDMSRQDFIDQFNLVDDQVNDMNRYLDHIDSLGTIQSKLVFINKVRAANHFAELGIRFTTKAAYASYLGII